MKKKIDIPTKVAKMRFMYHANMLDVNNVLNQMHLMSDEKAEKNNRRHTMTIVNDILPRLGYDVEKAFKN